MIFVITGATSFLGIEFCRYLISEGNEIYAICRKGCEKTWNLPQDVNLHIVYSDMSEYSHLDMFVEKADVFVNFAWGGTGHDGRNVQDVQKENVTNTIAAMFAADKMGCQVFIEAGSQAEYGTVLTKISEETPCRPFSEYGKAKLEIKNRLYELSGRLGMKYIHLRIFSLFGEEDHPWTLVMSSLKKMVNNEPVDLSPCTQNWNFLYVKDAVKQIYLLCQYALRKIDYHAEVFNIASKDTRVLKNFVEEMSALSQSKSELNFGAITPANVVSLDPDISKTETAIGFVSDYIFKDIINNIIRNFK